MNQVFINGKLALEKGKNNMKCVVCKNGDVVNGTTTVTLEKNASTIVFKQVPAMVCDNCGEKYVEADVSRQLLSKSREIINNGVEVDVRNFKQDAA